MPVVPIKEGLFRQHIASEENSSLDSSGEKADGPLLVTPERIIERGASVSRLSKQGKGLWHIRVSPSFLIACGSLFILLIVISSSFSQSDELEAEKGLENARTANFSANSNGSKAPTANARPIPQGLSQLKRPNAADPRDDSPVPLAANVDTPPSPVEVSAHPVTAASVPGTPHPEPGPSMKSSNGVFTTQVGSFNTLELATERSLSLRSAGLEVRVVPVAIPNRGTWYRVQSGNFNSAKDAEHYGADLKARKVVAEFIVTKSVSE